jgi:hypothetical protein
MDSTILPFDPAGSVRRMPFPRSFLLVVSSILPYPGSVEYQLYTSSHVLLLKASKSCRDKNCTTEHSMHLVAVTNTAVEFCKAACIQPYKLLLATTHS